MRRPECLPDGLRRYWLEPRDIEIETLVRRGLLLASEQTDRGANGHNRLTRPLGLP